LSFTSKVERTGNTAKVNVIVEAKKVDETINKEFRKLSKQLRFPGFRPGKAPRSVIEGQVGREYILATALEEVVNETYPLAVDSEELRTVGKVDFSDPDELVEGQDYSYTVEVDLRPELTLSSTNVTIDMVPKEATDEEIDAQVEGTLERFATYPTIEDKDVKIGEDSFLTFSFKSTIDGDDYDGSEVEKHLYQLGQGMMPEAFDKGLIGAKAGDKLNIEFEVEDTGNNEEFAGKTMKFDLTVDELNEKVLPKIDDDFAKQTGFDTVEDMRKEIKSYIDSQKLQQWDRIRDEKLLEELSKFLDGEPTTGMIEARADDMVAEFSRMLEQQGMELDSYLAQANIDPQQYEKDMEEQAAISVTNDLALEALARHKDLLPSDEDLDGEFTKAVDANPDSDMSTQDMRKSWVDRGMLTSLKDDLGRGRAMTWLRDNATINIDESASILSNPKGENPNAEQDAAPANKTTGAPPKDK